MFQVKRVHGKLGTEFHLSGEIDETVRLEEQFENIKPPLLIHTKGVHRINSAGARNWILFFEGLQKKGVPFYFVECSPAIVDQMNLIANFRAGGGVISIYVPFVCEKCRADLVGLFTIESLQQLGGKMPAQPCTKCGGTARFDEIESEYFGFLKRLK